jgi:hypothetical protein
MGFAERASIALFRFLGDFHDGFMTKGLKNCKFSGGAGTGG